MENNIQKVTCAICASESVSFYTEKDSFSIFRCASCGHGMVHPMPKSTEEIYGEDYFAGAGEGFGYANYDADKEPLRPFLTQELARVEKYAPSDSREVLDVGAATGFFLEIAKERGWQTRGVEISEFAARIACEKGLDVQAGILSQAGYFPESFDLITLWDVIEHVELPKEELVRVHKLLREGGLILMTTPNFSSSYAKLLGRRWHAIVPPEHLHYFTFKSMQQALEETGFETISITAPIKSFTLSYIFQTLARWQGLGIWKAIVDFLKVHPALGGLSLPLPLRDNMLVLARKK